MLEKPSLEELQHYGVKGMKWGVRRGYAQRVGRTAAQDRRVGAGKGSTGDKLSALGRSSALDLAGGFKRGARRRGERDAAHARRIKNGEETVHDLIRLYGTVRFTDIQRVKAKK